jgi:hypothetical protein
MKKQAKLNKSSFLNAASIHSVHHEGTQCTRKFGNPKAPILGKTPRFPEKRQDVKPSPAEYDLSRNLS